MAPPPTVSSVKCPYLPPARAAVRTLCVLGVAALGISAASTTYAAAAPGSVRSNPALATAAATATVPAGPARKVKARTVGAARSKPGTASGPLVYRGGSVLNVPRVYLSFWSSDWNRSTYQPAMDYVEKFFGSVGGSPWLGVTSQYCSGSLSPPYTACSGSSVNPISNPSTQLLGTWVDNTAVSYNSPASACGLSAQSPGDCDVMLAARRAAIHFGALPAGAQIMILTPSGLSQPGFVTGGWCAYHWATVGSQVAYSYLPFVPDAGGSCGENSVNSNGTFDGFSILGGHEYAEAITDPLGGGWYDASGAEIGDNCAWALLSNAILGGSPYAVQALWSNAADSCQLGSAPSRATHPPVLTRTGGSRTREDHSRRKARL
jgi:hypothetical protein